jgi:hypothetical protein
MRIADSGMPEMFRLIIAIALAFFSDSAAIAAESGQCYTRVDAQRAFELEQQTALFGSELDAPSAQSFIVWYNRSAGIGYLTLKDSALRMPANEVCIAARFSSLDLFGIRDRGMMSWVFDHRSPQEVAASCAVFRRLSRSTCSASDSTLRRLERDGFNLVALGSASFSHRSHVSAPMDVGIGVLHNPSSGNVMIVGLIEGGGYFAIANGHGLDFTQAAETEASHQETVARSWMDQPFEYAGVRQSHRQWDRMARDFRLNNERWLWLVSQFGSRGTTNPEERAREYLTLAEILSKRN